MAVLSHGQPWRWFSSYFPGQLWGSRESNPRQALAYFPTGIIGARSLDMQLATSRKASFDKSLAYVGVTFTFTDRADRAGIFAIPGAVLSHRQSECISAPPGVQSCFILGDIVRRGVINFAENQPSLTRSREQREQRTALIAPGGDRRIQTESNLIELPRPRSAGTCRIHLRFGQVISILGDGDQPGESRQPCAPPVKLEDLPEKQVNPRIPPPQTQTREKKNVKKPPPGTTVLKRAAGTGANKPFEGLGLGRAILRDSGGTAHRDVQARSTENHAPESDVSALPGVILRIEDLMMNENPDQHLITIANPPPAQQLLLNINPKEGLIVILIIFGTAPPNRQNQATCQSRDGSCPAWDKSVTVFDVGAGLGRTKFERGEINVSVEVEASEPPITAVIIIVAWKMSRTCKGKAVLWSNVWNVGTDSDDDGFFHYGHLQPHWARHLDSVHHHVAQNSGTNASVLWNVLVGGTNSTRRRVHH
ncbi:hypothetical protein DFH06DRAFT_1297389 [Mycena polygramma]|nr:hypothetical protein DFH06DRAFT_1297389 [Mycena polygramma]